MHPVPVRKPCRKGRTTGSRSLKQYPGEWIEPKSMFDQDVWGELGHRSNVDGSREVVNYCCIALWKRRVSHTIQSCVGPRLVRRTWEAAWSLEPCYKLRQRELQWKSQEWSRTNRSVAGAERFDLKHAWKCVLSWAVHLLSGAMAQLDLSGHAEASAWSPTGRSSRSEGWPLPKPSPAGKADMTRVGSGLTFQVLGWYERINQNLSRNIGRIGSYGQSRVYSPGTLEKSTSEECDWELYRVTE